MVSVHDFMREVPEHPKSTSKIQMASDGTGDLQHMINGIYFRWMNMCVCI